MGFRGKLMVEHTGIELPIEFVEKHQEDYYIGSVLEGPNKEPTFFVNIASKYEKKEHWEILKDLEALLRDRSHDVYGVVLWENGRIDRYNFSTGVQETFLLKDDY